jgi:hypothetical protein
MHAAMLLQGSHDSGQPGSVMSIMEEPKEPPLEQPIVSQHRLGDRLNMTDEVMHEDYYLQPTISDNMSDSVMDSYRIHHRNFPLTVYRVDYPGAQTTYSTRGGFQAASNFSPYHVNGLRSAVEYHLDWRSRVLSPFISVFDNRPHAVNWARLWNENNSAESCVATITIEAEDDVIVLRVVDLIDTLGLTPPLPRSRYHSEFLCFRRIPSEAIARIETVY